MTDRPSASSDSSSSSFSSSSDNQNKRRKQKQPRTAFSEVARVLGAAYSVSGIRLGYAIQLRHSKQGPLVCPIAFTGRHSTAAMERWILENALDAILSELRVSEVGATFRNLAGEKKVIVIEQRGHHKIVHGGHTFYATAWDGRIRYWGPRPAFDVLLVEDALKREARSGTVETWLAAFQECIEKNPRLLVLLCTSLSAALRRLLREPAFTLVLVAPTSTAKSTAQQVGSSLTGPPAVVTWNATNVGVQDWLAARPDQPAFIEDLHKADRFEDVAQIVMNVGNSAGRIRSQRSQGGGQATPIQASLIVSSEKSMASMASQGSAAGMLARCAEIHAGRHGLFDNLCGFSSGGELANHLQRLAAEHFGTMWPQWLKLLSKAWVNIQEWHTERLPKMRDSILENAGNPEPDELTGRLVDRLAFAAFSGCVATELGLWSIRKTIILAAFGQMLREHVDRSPPGRNALANAAIEAVRAYIETHHSKFPPLSAVNDPNKQSGNAGYLAKDRFGALFLFIPGVFADLFREFGDEVFVALKGAGYLATQPSRHNHYQKQVPTGAKGERRSMFFVAIREDIRYASKRK